MMKVLIPVAIGAGLLLLLTSNSKAATAMPPQSQPPQPPQPYDALPDALRQLVIQAHVTQDPGVFEVVAAQLELGGYPVQARLLRTQAQELRAKKGQTPVASTPNT